MRLGLTHSYAELPPAFHTTELLGDSGSARDLLAWNATLADELGSMRTPCSPWRMSCSPAACPRIRARSPWRTLATSSLTSGRRCDGRAILLGEKRDVSSVLRDLQLEGRRPHTLVTRRRWPRRGGPMLREYSSARPCMRWASRRRVRSPWWPRATRCCAIAAPPGAVLAARGSQPAYASAPSSTSPRAGRPPRPIRTPPLRYCHRAPLIRNWHHRRKPQLDFPRRGGQHSRPH